MSKRQSKPAPSVDPTLTVELPGSLVSGGSIGGRIAAVRKRRGLGKSEFARLIGKSYRLVHKWEEEGQNPDRTSLALAAQVLAVTIEELLGVVEGQDPPFVAWRDFLATPEGQSMDAGERRMLQSLAWPEGREPTAGFYQTMLVALRGGSRARN